MHYNVNVAVRYTSVLFGKGDGISKEYIYIYIYNPRGMLGDHEKSL